MSEAVTDLNEGSEPSELPVDRVSSVSAATRTIQTLFGADFGSCWGDFYCSHGRIRGRLFVVTNGILFFSSLLGFERRLCLQFADISALVLHRTTSIRIEIADYDTYIFRSFHDREKVLQLLIRLKRLVEKKRIRGHTTVGRSEYREGDNVASWEMQQIEYENCNRSFEHNPKSSLSFPALHTSFSSSNINRSIDDTGPLPNRGRAASDSIVQPNSTQTNHFIFESENRDTNSVQSSVSTIQESWEETTQILAGKKEIGVENLHLRCSLDEFYNLFLRDDASYSFDRYQKEKIHDRDVSITRWKNDEVKEISPDQIIMQTRVLSFTHPITNAMGLGPTEAKTTRRQFLCRYQDLGITIQNKTIVGGIPAADTFSVDDFWRIQSDGTDSVILSVNFEINFTKRTMFKNIIEKSVLRETRAWLLGYSAMTNEVLTEEKEARVASKACPATASNETARVIANDSTRIQMINFVATSLLITCLVVVIVYVQILCKSAADIKNELLALRVLSKQILLRLENE